MTPVASLGPRTLTGRFVALEPLEARHHTALIEAAADPAIWTYIPFDAREGFAPRLPAIAHEMAQGRQIAFAVRRLADGRIVGSTSYLAIAPADAKVEIGSTWYTADARGGTVNPEAKLLLLENAFAAHYNRVEFKTNARNAPSRAALLKLGARGSGRRNPARPYVDAAGLFSRFGLLLHPGGGVAAGPGRIGAAARGFRLTLFFRPANAHVSRLETERPLPMALIGPSGRPIATPEPQASSGEGGTHVKDSSLETFAADVLDASREVPVIVDFWAPWCGPCKQLGPVLEKVVGEAKGAVRLVKVNIDENQEIARQLRIQSIPAVFAFKDGQPFDGFMGNIPESQVRAFVASLTGGGHGGHDHAGEVLAAAEEAFNAGDIAMAAQAYAHVLQDEPGHPKAVAGLARCYLKSGDLERAKTTLQLVRPDGAGDEAVRAVEAELQLTENAKAVAGKDAELRARLEADPKDHQARYDLALALDAKGDREAALDTLLDSVRRDRKWNDEAARKHLVTLFEAMGPTDPRTIAARRKLSSILFS